MFERIKGILDKKEMKGWTLLSRQVTSTELFFIKEVLDMNRGKDVHHLILTVYIDFVDEGKNYTGLSTIKLAPNMTDDEIAEKVDLALYSARFVKNEPFDLVEPGIYEQKQLGDRFSEGKLVDWAIKGMKTIYRDQPYDYGWINSTEFFINYTQERVMNSLGVDYGYDYYEGEVEVVIDWNQEDAVEIHEIIRFADYDETLLLEVMSEAVNNASMRAIAKPTPRLKDVQVLFAGDAVTGIVDYYVGKTSASSIYMKTSHFNLGSDVFEEVSGDKVTLELLPYLKNSTGNRPVDSDGIVLSPCVVLDEGRFVKIHGSSRFSQYLNVPATGVFHNVSVSPGTFEMDGQPYLKVVKFSSFSVNNLTGDFGGEIRLAYYFDGEKEVPVTGGSVTGNILDLQKEFYLSKELKQQNDYLVPKYIVSKNVSIAGV